MGEALGIPEWLAMTGFVFAGLAIWLTLGFVLHGRAMRRLAAKRPNPTRQDFLEMMSESVEEDSASWLWDQAQPYYQPHTPHPDDHLSEDAMIDDGDWSMDWPREFADSHGFSEKAYPDWPQDWLPTIRNFGRWLDMGKAAGT
jgi:hypothetical protein